MSIANKIDQAALLEKARYSAIYRAAYDFHMRNIIRPVNWENATADLVGVLKEISAEQFAVDLLNVIYSDLERIEGGEMN